ncbi:DUF362 domain-containing protein [Paludisphaera soli]|uniref:DUF362 domain-containing protein n=1 Tax=Paludisphaera soli TaxID=2712865 RepID=UPI0013EB2C09|nr:DUF362 domain-containing protein [Paludisphaera soli]
MVHPDEDLIVAIADRPGDPDKGIAEALGHLDLDDFRDKVVCIKPNDTTAEPDDTKACTQADTLRATIRHIKTLRPKSIVVSGGSGAKKTPEVFKILGYDEVIAAEGVEFFDHNQPPFLEVDLPYGPQRKIVVNPRVLEYERVVSLAQLKVHRTATVTMAIKNIAMSYPCAEFYGYPRVEQKKHPHNILKDKQAFLVGMAMRFPIHLAIVSGHPAMIGTGPIDGKAVETGLVIAGRNATAVDSVGAFLLGFETNGVQHLRQAEEVGLGETYRPSTRDGGDGRLKIKGLAVEKAVEVFRTAAYGEAF